MNYLINKINTTLFIILTFIVVQNLSAENIILWGNYRKAPKIFETQQKAASGILVEISQLIAQKTNNTIEIKLAPWARAYYQAENTQNKNTGIIGIKKNARRLKKFDFSEPIYNDSNYLVVLKNRQLNITRLEQLKGLRVSYNRQGYFGPVFEKAKQYFVDMADTNNQLRLKKLLLGRIDAALVGGPGKLGLKMALSKDKELKDKIDQFEFLPFEFSTPDHIAFAKSLKQQKQITEFNAVIKELIQSGEIQKIIDRYANSY